MKILILEDELPAFEKLLISLQSYFGNDMDYDWGRSLVEMRSFLAGDQTYDIILSDIQLLDGSVFDLLEHMELDVPIVFCSAHDNYLLDAFHVNGIAYVLKPYTQADLVKALDKYTILFREDGYTPLDSEKIQDIKNAIEDEKKHFRTRFVIKKSGGIHLLKVDDVSLIEAEGDICKLIDSRGNMHVFSQNIGGIEMTLDPKYFFRINRSQIVNIEQIQKIEKYFKNRLVVHLQGSKEKAITSTGQTAAFRTWLDG